MSKLQPSREGLDLFPDGGGQTSLRRMRRTDLNQVARIESLSFRSPWPADYFRNCLTVGFECWVAERKGRIDGYAVMSTARAVAHLMNLCIAPAMRRRGLGRRLLARMIRVAARSARTLVLEVRITNRAAIDLYRSMGFHEAGLRKGYYPTPSGREDALVLSLHLSRREGSRPDRRC